MAGRRPLISAGLFVLILVAFALSPAPRSSAHALLSSAEPGVNASLREAPSVITANFTEPLQHAFSAIEVYAPDGQRVDRGEALFNEADANRMSVELEGLDPAIYTVVWKTLSAVDGHTYVGSYTFTLLNPDGSFPGGGAYAFGGGTGSGGSPTWVDGAFKAAGLFAGVALAGGFLFVALAGLPASRGLGEGRAAEVRAFSRLLGAAVLLLVPLALTAEVYLLFEQANQLGEGFSVLDEIVFDTQFGRWWIYRLALLLAVLAAGIFAVRQGRRGESIAWPVAVGAVLASAQLLGSSPISHGAAAAQGEFWGVGADFLHLLFVAAWLGSLGFLMLTLLARRRHVDPRRWRRYSADMLGRFSALAASSVALVIVTGITGAVIQLPSLDSISETDYGVTFIVKMALVAALLAVASTNAFLLRPGIITRRASPSADPRLSILEGRMRLAIRLEIALAIAVVGVTGLLTQLPTARVVTQEEATRIDLDEVQLSAFTGDAEVGEGTASLLINPAQVGLNRIRVDFDGDSGPVSDVTLNVEHATAGASQVPLRRADPATWSVDGSFFGLDGPWDVVLYVQRESLDDTFAEFRMQVFPAPPPLPAADSGGAFALPAPQLDWNTVGGLWLLTAGGLLILWREPLTRRTARASVPALSGGAFSIFVGFALVVGGDHSEPGADLDNPVPLADESVATGEMLYVANCAQCHGDTGRGDGPLADELRPPPANFLVHVPFHTDGTLYAWITHGIPGTAMPAWREELTDEERWHLVNYLRANFNEPPPLEPVEIRAR
ncbi:MAG: c-type cytochrome [Dehalococcoidia bacterium]|nr:c-type cytochrome [Dehalococcoidia bacterium]